jgi:low temperature requirement protein LtrA
MFAICWAWINFSWFASAYDTDDWAFRLLTMVQMAGVLILALGLPEMFESVHAGDHIDNWVMVAGYVVMRVAMVGQWLRVMREDPARRPCAMTERGLSLAWSQVVVALAPVVTIVGYETIGYRHVGNHVSNFAPETRVQSALMVT